MRPVSSYSTTPATGPTTFPTSDTKPNNPNAVPWLSAADFSSTMPRRAVRNRIA
ncbi:MAG: hypothetical protein M3422_18425 [Actinomycetota bacterium]|nr:hypothetical protein [Actinomycetota bacterium]